jgi:hypothetical protein
VPTPVGPLGPGEIDPNDPDLWNWDDDDGGSSPRRQPLWIRVTAYSIAAVFVIVIVIVLSLFR